MMRGFFADLTQEQKEAALAYRGDENHGDEQFMARELHRRRCHSAGIWDEAQIAEYWLGCNRSMYRRKALQQTPGA